MHAAASAGALTVCVTSTSELPTYGKREQRPVRPFCVLGVSAAVDCPRELLSSRWARCVVPSRPGTLLAQPQRTVLCSAASGLPSWNTIMTFDVDKRLGVEAGLHLHVVVFDQAERGVTAPVCWASKHLSAFDLEQKIPSEESLRLQDVGLRMLREGRVAELAGAGIRLGDMPLRSDRLDMRVLQPSGNAVGDAPPLHLSLAWRFDDIDESAAHGVEVRAVASALLTSILTRCTCACCCCRYSSPSRR
jgi:hypothetical protein